MCSWFASQTTLRPWALSCSKMYSPMGGVCDMSARYLCAAWLVDLGIKKREHSLSTSWGPEITCYNRQVMSTLTRTFTTCSDCSIEISQVPGCRRTIGKCLIYSISVCSISFRSKWFSSKIEKLRIIQMNSRMSGQRYNFYCIQDEKNIPQHRNYTTNMSQINHTRYRYICRKFVSFAKLFQI